MAYVNTQYCFKCQTDRTHTNGKCCFCSACEQTARDKEFTDLSLQDQILKLKARIEALENRGGKLN